jgi:hypothetical protein
MRGGTDIGAAALGLLQQHCLPPSLKLYGGQWQVEGKVSLSRLALSGQEGTRQGRLSADLDVSASA